jgi:curved DNA-binding protein CbpA
MTETFYDRLGVSSDATTEEIETAYREAIKQVHPDVSDEVGAGERTKRLNKAKRVLTDEAERARYDRLGHDSYTSNRSGESGAKSDSTSDGDRSEWTDRPPSESAWKSSKRQERRSGRRRERHTGPRWRDGSGDGHARRGRDSRDREDDGNTAEQSAGGTEQTARRTGRSVDGTTRSRGDSRGPSWQSSGVADGGPSQSAARQAADGSTDGPNVDWSWNAWESTGAWAIRQGSDAGRRLRPSRLFPTTQSAVLLGSIFFCYPFFVGSTLYPPFPLVARLAVGVCTILMFAYLLSIPEAAVAVFGLWSVFVPLFLLVVPSLSLFSLAGVIGLFATWVPLGIAVLTLSIVRP